MKLQTPDLIIIFLSLLLAVFIGVRFSLRQNSTKAYFAANGKLPSWAVGMSMFATIISSVTFLAYPGAAYAGNWILLVQGLMVPLVLLVIIWFIVPLYRRIVKLSTYEYFERRFGPFARYYSSLAFVLEHFAKMGTILYLMGMALETFTGLNITLVIVTVGLVTILLTYLGGIEAIVWMDVVQGFLLIVGGLLSVGIIFWLTDGGAAALLQVAGEHHKIDFGPYRWDFHERTFWVLVINGLFYAVQKYGTDQSIVQRYMAARDDRGAIKAALMGILLSVPTWALFMFVGTCLFAFYQLNPTPEVALLKADEVFPYFIANELPTGICGLIIAALAAGAISSIDSDINCISAVIVEDYYGKIRKKATDGDKLFAGRLATLIIGILGIFIALLYVSWGGEGVLGTLFALYAIISAGIVGIFLLGLFSRRANWQGLYIGIAAAVIFTAYAVLTTTHYTTADGTERLMIDLGPLNFTHHTLMLGVYSHLIVLVVGWTASHLFPSAPAAKELTIYGYLEQKRSHRR